MGVGKAKAVFERFAERRQFAPKIGMFGEQRLLLPFIRRSAAHVANEVQDGVAMSDVDIELVEGVAAKIFEVFLHLHSDILPREVMDELIPVSPELVGNRREKDHYRHGGRRSSSAAILPHLNNAEHSRCARRPAPAQRVLRWLGVYSDVILPLAGRA
jgi:hypothetical protein